MSCHFVCVCACVHVRDAFPVGNFVSWLDIIPCHVLVTIECKYGHTIVLFFYIGMLLQCYNFIF